MLNPARKLPSFTCLAAALLLSVLTISPCSAQAGTASGGKVVTPGEASQGANGLPALVQSRGALLYTTHCVACHTSEVHWREKGLVTDWKGLLDQVRRWQVAVSLSWSDADILEVSRHLNDSIYHFEQPAVPARPLSMDSSGASAKPMVRPMRH